MRALRTALGLRTTPQAGRTCGEASAVPSLSARLGRTCCPLHAASCPAGPAPARRGAVEINRSIALACLLGCTTILVHSFVDFNLQIPANSVWFCVLAILAASPYAVETRVSATGTKRTRPCRKLPPKVRFRGAFCDMRVRTDLRLRTSRSSPEGEVESGPGSSSEFYA
jgi:hypothetical protein